MIIKQTSTRQSLEGSRIGLQRFLSGESERSHKHHASAFSVYRNTDEVLPRGKLGKTQESRVVTVGHPGTLPVCCLLKDVGNLIPIINMFMISGGEVFGK